MESLVTDQADHNFGTGHDTGAILETIYDIDVFWIIVLIAACSCTASAQTLEAEQSTREDSISVSAGFTSEELQIAEQFDTKLATARQAVRVDPKSAIDQMEALIAQLETHAFLEHHRVRLLVQLGQASLAAGAPKKAVGYYQQRLALAAESCKPQSSYPVECGRARMDVGIAKIAANERDGLGLLVQAVEDHRLQIELDGKPEELHHFVHLRHLSEATIVLGIMYERMGKFADARIALQESRNAAMKILECVEVQDSLREEAKQFLMLIQNQEAAFEVTPLIKPPQ